MSYLINDSKSKYADKNILKVVRTNYALTFIDWFKPFKVI